MNPTGKKFISFFLVLSLLTINCASRNFLRTTFGKERRGVLLKITKKDGKTISGELFAVRNNSLLLSPGKDVSVDIEEIKRIEVIKKSKSKFWPMVMIGGGIGMLIGGSIGVVKGLNSNDPVFTPGLVAVIWGIIDAGIGGAVGASSGALIWIVTGTDSNEYKTIQIEGMTDSEIQETLDKLRKKARIHDYEYYPRTEQETDKKEEKVEALEFKIKVKVEEASIRLRPQEQSEVIAKVSLDTVFAPERKVGEWYQVSFRDEQGFILLGYIHESEVDVLEEIIRNLKNTRDSGLLTQAGSYS